MQISILICRAHRSVGERGVVVICLKKMAGEKISNGATEMFSSAQSFKDSYMFFSRPWKMKWGAPVLFDLTVRPIKYQCYQILDPVCCCCTVDWNCSSTFIWFQTSKKASDFSISNFKRGLPPLVKKEKKKTTLFSPHKIPGNVQKESFSFHLCPKTLQIKQVWTVVDSKVQSLQPVLNRCHTF